MKNIIKIFSFIILSLVFTQFSYADSNDRFDDAKKLFENKKQEIIHKVESWKMNSNEGKNIITKEREKIISDTKNKIIEDKNNEIKTIIKQKLSPKLTTIDNQSDENKEIIYSKLIEKLNKKLDDNNINKNQKIIIDIMINVFENKKNNLE